MQEDIDALMHDYAGKVPGASVLVMRDGQAVVRRSYGFADLEAGTPHAGNQLPPRIGQQAVHSRRDPVARAGRQARARRSGPALAARRCRRRTTR